MHVSSRKRNLALYCALFCSACLVGELRATVIDHLSDYNVLIFTSNVNGIGQTFTAPDPFLQDASLALTESPDGRVWWNDAHIQVFHGFPDSFGATGNTAIFTSPQIDFTSLPQIGTSPAGRPIFELRFSTHGLSALLPLVAGDVYTMTLSNFGTTGDAFYASHQPSFYPDGIYVNHLYPVAEWRGFDVEDLAFRLVTVPEPSFAGIGVLWMIIAARHLQSPHPDDKLLRKQS